MSHIFNTLTGLITPELISKTASFLGEDNSKVASAVGSIIPSLLAALLAKGDDPNLESALAKGGKESDGILSNITDIFSGHGDEKSSYVGSRFIDSLLGDKLGGLISLVASSSGISKEGVSKLVSIVSPLVSGFLGKKMIAGGGGLFKLLSILNSEKDDFLESTPSGLNSVLGIPSLIDLGGSLSFQTTAVHDPKKGSFSLIKWLFLIIALLALFFLWKTCQSGYSVLS